MTANFQGRNDSTEFLKKKLVVLTRVPRILIVDDDAADRFLLKNLLSRYKVEVVECSNESTAVDIIVNNEFNIVFLDVRLIEGDGFDVYKRVKATKPDQTIIVMTGYDDVSIREKLLEISPQFFWRKPIKASDLDNIFETLKPNA